MAGRQFEIGETVGHGASLPRPTRPVSAILAKLCPGPDGPCGEALREDRLATRVADSAFDRRERKLFS
jgi:hypothetical protein